MSRLLICLNKWLDGQNLPQGVIAEVSASGLTKPIRVVIPAGTSGQTVPVEVKPGVYLVRAFLPSGELASKDVMLNEHEDVTVVLRASESPHEWLSWHHFVGNVLAESSSYHAIQQEGIPRGTKPTWFLWSTDSGDKESFYPKFEEGPEEHRSGVMATQSQLVRFSSDSNAFFEALSFKRLEPKRDPTEWGRFFVTVKPEGAPVQIAALPFPWPMIRQPGVDAPVDVLIDNGLLEFSTPEKTPAERDDRFRLSCIVRDELGASLMGYLASGDFIAADFLYNSLVVSAEDLLYGKFQNPYAAALGGYFLLQASAWDRLHHWPRNLANWFEWLPDGAVIHGWQCLHENKTVEAREYFLLAASRGVPVFTVGLRFLLDGLSLFAAQQRQGEAMGFTMDEALKRVRQYAAVAHFNQAFTTFLGADPGIPLLIPESVTWRKTSRSRSRREIRGGQHRKKHGRRTD